MTLFRALAAAIDCGFNRLWPVETAPSYGDLADQLADAEAQTEVHEARSDCGLFEASASADVAGEGPAPLPDPPGGAGHPALQTYDLRAAATGLTALRRNEGLQRAPLLEELGRQAVPRLRRNQPK
ncbi:hypothetical protein BMW24_003620 [Mycobacterium heckeshornense]|uniref:hypothetical protein n=1 Tax=Mycobacterium heckeshornense TaxID=110505 RepID=UPI0008FD2E24|nr:hypothetical protein [Mycobacterium heckeshornense]PIJ36764.1 hypothetical protein BMW24_003335 [Mycobacterium heckeshornense]PIJ36815.1 hypothetical protein BMW24_003620 [Mycobacterium heckeshornense]